MITLENQIVFTNKAKCLDCNRCVRVCPVKAIQIKDGQASVCGDKCIECGTCIKECPQNAKTYKNDLQRVRELLENGNKVAAILAPSFAVTFEKWKARKIPSLLRFLGFDYVAEASVTAGMISKATMQYAKEHKNAVISSACPAVVNLIEIYHPELVEKLAPIDSPMIATAKQIQNLRGYEWKSVFIGPCVAKKSEAERRENKPFVEAALTFEELVEWINERNIDLQEFEDGVFDLQPSKTDKLFALSGGLYESAGQDVGNVFTRNIAVSGYDEIIDSINDIKKHGLQNIIEPLFCKYGCINGPRINTDVEMLERKRRLLDYANEETPITRDTIDESLNITTKFHDDCAIYTPKFSDDEINSVLNKIGRANPEDQLNCTSCGYPTCREKAIAVLNGMAEEEMCVPFIRKRMQMQADKIIEVSPNGIVVIDEKYKILNMNPAFRKMFMCSNAFVGKPISTVIDAELFIKLMTGDAEQLETTARYENFNLTCKHIVYRLNNENKYVGVFINLTNLVMTKSKLDDIKRQTVLKASELLEHQIEMAQKIAKLLGESTAQGEEIVSNLLTLTEGEKNNFGGTPWDTFISK